MHANVLVQSYDTYGGHSSISIIGDLLEQAARDLDCGVAAVEVTACFRTNRPPKPTLEALQSEFHAELEGLPRLRWEPKRRRLSVRYESRLGLAEQVLEHRPPSQALLRAAVEEFVALLRTHTKALSRKPGLDVERLIELVDSLNGLVPMTDSDVAAVQAAHAERRRAERSRLPWWEQLEIDWAEYHPAARELLNDPFFWSEVDDYSPHGNDTGADLIHDFRAWRRAHKSSPPSVFLQRVLQDWGISTEWRRLPIEEWDDELAIQTHDEAAVALAFALIKLEGACDNAVRTVAIESIRRWSDPRVASHFGRKVSPEWAEASDKLRQALETSGSAKRTERSEE